MHIYKCIYCGEEFDTPKTKKELLGEHFGRPYYEPYYVCPFCETEIHTDTEVGDNE